MTTLTNEPVSITTTEDAIESTKKVAVIVERELYNAVSKIARDEMRSIRAQFAHIVTDYIKRRTDDEYLP